MDEVRMAIVVVKLATILAGLVVSCKVIRAYVKGDDRMATNKGRVACASCRTEVTTEEALDWLYDDWARLYLCADVCFDDWASDNIDVIGEYYKRMNVE